VPTAPAASYDDPPPMFAATDDGPHGHGPCPDMGGGGGGGGGDDGGGSTTPSTPSTPTTPSPSTPSEQDGSSNPSL
jgi:hypothetical protein